MSLMNSANGLRLDDLYKMTALIYSDRNSIRSKEATFAHFVEVCGMLTVYDRKKKREGLEVADALCKALGWYFPLLAKLQIKSVEALIFRKFPGVCPYCRQAPHNEAACKLVKGTGATVNHDAVIDHFNKNWDSRPKRLDDWQQMFDRIYPRSVNDNGRSTIGLLEELGELAEAIRVFDVHPHYFMGEAADTFSYIIGFANEHRIREAQEGREFSFEREYLIRYPGLCSQCGYRICMCPAIPQATIGRMAKEIQIGQNETPFISDQIAFANEGKQAAHIALESMGGYPGLAERLPFDRGDANRGLVQLCLKVSAAIEVSNPELAGSLRAEALKLGDSAKAPGTQRQSLQIESLINTLKNMWKELGEELRTEIKDTDGLVGDLGELFESIRILFVYSSPEVEEGQLKLLAEQRAIQKALDRSKNKNKISIEQLPAATPEDIRKTLLRNEFDIVHFSGHANEEVLVFESETNEPAPVKIAVIADLIKAYPSVKCVILNACQSVKTLTTPISPITIGMDESIPDNASIAFSRGFYDALAEGMSIARAYSEGILAVGLAGFDTSYIRILVAQSHGSEQTSSQ